MSFVPVVVMALILLVTTVLLGIADRLLVTYGECRIKIRRDEDEREIVVQGGNYLLRELKNNGVELTSSCGGKCTCGYCKVTVREGAGSILPTEEVFVSREEKRAGTRLACAVKVKNDMEIYIPDFLTTVRTIVKNESYDPKLKWKFHTDDQKLLPEHTPPTVELSDVEQEEIEKIVAKHQGVRGGLIPALQDISDRFNYLPEKSLSVIAAQLDIPLSMVFRTATFYNAFSLKPRGKHIISVCMGTACHVKGAPEVLAALEDELGVKAGDTTEDLRFTLEEVRCIGCCGLAPVLKVGEDIHGHMSRKKVPELIESYREA